MKSAAQRIEQRAPALGPVPPPITPEASVFTPKIGDRPTLANVTFQKDTVSQWSYAWRAVIAGVAIGVLDTMASRVVEAEADKIHASPALAAAGTFMVVFVMLVVVVPLAIRMAMMGAEQLEQQDSWRYPQPPVRIHPRP